MWIFIRFLFLVIPVIGLYHECIPGSLVWKKLIYIEQKGAGGSVVQACMYSFVFETPWRRLLGTKSCRSFLNLYEVCKHITCNCLWVWLIAHFNWSRVQIHLLLYILLELRMCQTGNQETCQSAACGGVKWGLERRDIVQIDCSRDLGLPVAVTTPLQYSVRRLRRMKFSLIIFKYSGRTVSVTESDHLLLTYCLFWAPHKCSVWAESRISEC